MTNDALKTKILTILWTVDMFYTAALKLFYFLGNNDSATSAKEKNTLASLLIKKLAKIFKEFDVATLVA